MVKGVDNEVLLQEAFFQLQQALLVRRRKNNSNATNKANAEQLPIAEEIAHPGAIMEEDQEAKERSSRKNKKFNHKTNSLGTTVSNTVDTANKKEANRKGTVLSEFMHAANEPITWIEAIELWRDMRSTNISKLPTLDTSVHSLVMNISKNGLKHNSEKLILDPARVVEESTRTTSNKDFFLDCPPHQYHHQFNNNHAGAADDHGSMKNNSSSPAMISNIDYDYNDTQRHQDKDEKNSQGVFLNSIIDTIINMSGGGSATSKPNIENDNKKAKEEESGLKKEPSSPNGTLLVTSSTDEENDHGNEIDNSKLYNLTPEEIIEVARGIKEIYGIRQSDDISEFKFVMGALCFLWLTVCTLIIVGQFYSSPTLGQFTWKVLVEAVSLFVAEVLWECVLSSLVIKFNIKINYTRKLGNLFKVPKYFVADFFPFYESTATSMVSALAINQTLFCLMYYRFSREQFRFFAYVFLSQDRREDRPDTIIFQVTEDIMRFGIYFPFKLFVANRVGVPALIFIPIAVNNIGDGLAEPVGVAFGKHKYSTTALYHKGKFFKSKFTRSYEGSACVFITTLVVVAIYYSVFTTTQFWITISLLPLLMTIAEAKAPHTNDGPFLALVGCSFLSAILLS